METELKQRKKVKKHEKVEEVKEKPLKIEENGKRPQQEVDDEPSKKLLQNACKESISSIKSKIQKATNNYLNKDISIPQVTFTIEYDLFTILLFVVAFVTRTYKLWTPNNVVFDELHYGKYVSLYMKQIFFFDQHPPLGKQLIAAVGFLTGFDGNYNFTKIGTDYTPNVPVVALRFVPALCGSLLSPLVYNLLLQLKVNRSIAVLGGLLVIFDNALLTQSRFILLEAILVFFTILGIFLLLKFLNSKPFSVPWLFNGILSSASLSAALCTKYCGIYAIILAVILICKHLWSLLSDKTISDLNLAIRSVSKFILFTVTGVSLYIGVFYVHLNLLQNAGPHDAVMTSAFQASLNGGLASITRGQPIKVVHGSQVTLKHTHGRTCWIHSHAQVYPIRYPDKRGSSHQQQVTCYSYKDVNNWWIVKKPEHSNLVVGDPIEPIHDGDQIQLIHGITGRALNSHDVAAPMSPQWQEVACYIDYNISMPANLLWKVEVVNKQRDGEEWHAITSQIRLIHVATGAALKFSGKQLPDWAFNQHEVVADRMTNEYDTIWNVEEHRYTKAADEKEREMQLLNAEMIPTEPTSLTFYEKFKELQMKMLMYSEKSGNTHMYSSDPLEWPLLDKGIAYWVSKTSNAQIHFLGNIVIWYSCTLSLAVYASLFVFYLLRRHRNIHDIPESEWNRFIDAGTVFFIGYLIHYLPYFCVERTLFLHNYLPAFMFKLLLLCYVIDHCYYLITKKLQNPFGKLVFEVGIFMWFLVVVLVFRIFSSLSYGNTNLSVQDVLALRWKDTWDFILHKT